MTQNVVTYTVEVITDNSSGRLLPYLTANVQFELDRRSNVFLVPNAALRLDADGGTGCAGVSRGLDAGSAVRAKRNRGRDQRPAAGKSAAPDELSGRSELWLPEGDVRATRYRCGSG